MVNDFNSCYMLASRSNRMFIAVKFFFNLIDAIDTSKKNMKKNRHFKQDCYQENIFEMTRVCVYTS